MQRAGPTKRQRQILEIVRAWIRERGVAPTYGEIAQAMRLKHRSVVQRQVKALERLGYVEITGVSRGMRLLREGTPVVEAKQLAAASTDDESASELPRLSNHETLLSEFEARPDFFVRIEDGWLDTGGFGTGDLLAVHTKRRPGDGAVVLARVGETATLGRFARIDSRTAHLCPLDPSAEQGPVPIGRRTNEAEILGIVVGAIVRTQSTTN